MYYIVVLYWTQMTLELQMLFLPIKQNPHIMLIYLAGQMHIVMLCEWQNVWCGFDKDGR